MLSNKLKPDCTSVELGGDPRKEVTYTTVNLTCCERVLPGGKEGIERGREKMCNVTTGKSVVLLEAM